MDEYLLNKVQCEFGITSQEVSPEEITQCLNIKPSRAYSKGDEFSTLNGTKTMNRAQNLWVIASDSVISAEEDISMHIRFFQNLFADKIDKIINYKNNDKVQVSFLINIKTEMTCYTFDLSNDEMQFLISISNRISSTIFTKEKINKE